MTILLTILHAEALLLTNSSVFGGKIVIRLLPVQVLDNTVNFRYLITVSLLSLDIFTY